MSLPRAGAAMRIKNARGPGFWRPALGLWRRFWERAPRQLRFTREGKLLVGLALAVGFGAVNTGNNLLFLGWGLVLSAILLSGVLSEAALRPLRLQLGRSGEARAGASSALPVMLANDARRLPAFGIEVAVAVHGPDGIEAARAPYQLRVEPGEQLRLAARFTPARRGLHHVLHLVASTAYPFGFFEKSRRFVQARPVEVWVYPRAVDTRALSLSLLTRLGDAPAGVAGAGEDFFSLRPYKPGDDPRRVHWRRSARLRRWVVVETEAMSGSRLLLELQLRRPGAEPPLVPEMVEHAVATLGSLAEQLLARGMSVGIRAPGVLLPPDLGPPQRDAVLRALARLRPDDAVPPPAAGTSDLLRVALAPRPDLVLPGATVVLPVPPMEKQGPPAAVEPFLSDRPGKPVIDSRAESRARLRS